MYSCFHNVTLGLRFSCLGAPSSLTKADQLPKVEDNVTVFASSTVLGPVLLCEGSSVAAGSIVLTSIPRNSIAIGNPAHLKLRGERKVLNECFFSVL